MLPRLRPVSLALLVGLLVATEARVLRAQEAALTDDAGTPPAAPALVAPELLERVEAPYPPDALAQQVEATVVLRIFVQTDGRVGEAEVVEPAGLGFDEAAREALLGSRFRPATRDGTPVAARILYRYEFRLPPPPPPVVEPAPAPAAPPPASVVSAPVAASTAPAEPVEVRVRGKLTEEERIIQSAEAVTVVNLEQAQERSGDMGEVLARTFGVNVRRSGGLGTDARFSLNGLQGEQVSFFVDEVPLELVFPGQFANIPVNLVERVEIYQGVVPIRFGSDALGGVVNYVTDRSYETGGAASYQIGSYGMHRLTLLARYRHEPSGFFVGFEGFFDRTRNDYEIDVEVPDERGRLRPARVERFHDGYRAYGAAPELGFADRRWARRLVLRPFFTGYDKELQHNIIMSVPYGEVEYGERLAGGLLRYEVELVPDLELELLAVYARRTTDFEDQGKWVYDWYGNRVRERRVAGEIESDPTDQTYWQHTAYARALLKWNFLPGHSVRLALTPRRPTRTGNERIQADPSSRDPLTAQRDLFTMITGLEYEASFFPTADAPSDPTKRDTNTHYVLQNVLFAKSYLYRMQSEDPLPGGIFREQDKSLHRFGIGDGVRVRLTSWAFVKASYELATRLPREWEVFGDGILVQANLEILPETSHNANLGARVDLKELPIGSVMVDINGTYRDTDRQIVLLGNDRYFSYQNVFRAIGKGVQGSAEWVAPGQYASVDGNFTYMDTRNASDKGTFGAFEGDRIPNRPYFFANWGTSLRFASLLMHRDALEPFYLGRYTHEFFRGWESQGLRESKQVVDSQLSHGLGLTYSVERRLGRLSATAEAENVTSARLYDFFGVQRPGRAYNLKLTGWF
jgi:vitamin B12 transporter